MSDRVLDMLDERRVFSIEAQKDGTFVIEEGCDLYFSAKLTKDQLLQLSREIAELADSVTVELPEAQKTL